MITVDVDLEAVGAPRLVMDRDAVERNLARLLDAAEGTPLRVATKSVRVRSVIEAAVARDGITGLLTYSAAEAVWLAENGSRDLLVAYPSVDVETFRVVASDPMLREQITFMADLPEHVRLLGDIATEAGSGSLRVAFDIDCSLKIGPVTIGAHRSSLRTPADAEALARIVAGTPGVTLVGAMFYEAQVAGVPDSTPVHRLIKRRSMQELAQRRKAVVRAMSRHADLEFVNGGGTGSIHLTREDPTVTDIAFGSGLFSSTLFDNYRDLRTEPAMWFVSPVVRKPAPDLAVTYSGGYVASGPPGSSRVPQPVHPKGLRYFGQEGAGEVQTPLHGPGAAGLRVGDLVWFRHAKAGEVCERFDTVDVVEGGAVVGRVPTYRGEGQNFG